VGWCFVVVLRRYFAGYSLLGYFVFEEVVRESVGGYFQIGSKDVLIENLLVLSSS
jgi:hypothetical protein